MAHPGGDNGKKGKWTHTTCHICCADEFPNTFTFSPSAEAVYTTWHAGDTYIVYPDTRSFIRFERLVEGIQDAEKIRVPRKEYSGKNSRELLEQLTRLEEAINFFKTREPSDYWQERLNEAKQLLNS